MKISRQQLLQILGSISFVILFVYGVKYLGEDTIRQSVVEAGIWAPVLMILMKIATIVVAPLSGVPLYLLAGTLFGVGEGLLYVLIGDAIGYSIAFWISRLLGRAKIESLISKNESGILSKLVGRISTIKGFIVACFMFCFASEIVAYAAGLSRLAFRHFFFIFMTGDAIAAFIIIWTSNKVGISFGLVSLVIGTLILVSLISHLIAKWCGRKKID